VEIFFKLSGLSNFDALFPIFLQYPIDIVLTNKLLKVMEPFPMFLDEGLVNHRAINRLNQFHLNISDPTDADQKLERFSNASPVDV
jgi:hypothetical protein